MIEEARLTGLPTNIRFNMSNRTHVASIVQRIAHKLGMILPDFNFPEYKRS